MNTTILATILDALGSVAPDLDPTSISGTEDLRDDLGLDSMDSLNLAAALHQRTGVSIPDRDLPKLRTVADICAYLEEAAP